MIIADILQLIVLVLIIASGFFAIKLKDILASIISLAIMGLLLALEFYILQAPDVAIAEASIGACLTIAIFIITIQKTKEGGVACRD